VPSSLITVYTSSPIITVSHNKQVFRLVRP